ncbi:MAG: hypothetical protein NUW02_01175 [Candidatus Campbellbacteria bacterium]|nr:hypothetical protein [Candidatus Campbellbacteria bacterium]
MPETRLQGDEELIKYHADYILRRLYEVGTPPQVMMPAILISERLSTLAQFDSPEKLRAVIAQIIRRVQEDAERFEKEFWPGTKLPNSPSLGGTTGG